MQQPISVVVSAITSKIGDSADKVTVDITRLEIIFFFILVFIIPLFLKKPYIFKFNFLLNYSFKVKSLNMEKRLNSVDIDFVFFHFSPYLELFRILAGRNLY